VLIIVVRQLYTTNETAQSNGIAMPSDGLLFPGVNLSVPTDQPSENAKWTPELESDIVDGEPLRDAAVAMVGRKDLVEVKRVIRQAEEAKPSCHIDPLQDERVQDEPSQDKPRNDRVIGCKFVEEKLTEIATTDNSHGSDTVGDKPASDAHTMSDNKNSAQSTSVGSKRIVRAATGLSDVSGAGMSTNEDRDMENDVALGNLTEANFADRHTANIVADVTSADCDAMKPSRVMMGISLEKPIDSNALLHKLDVVGSAKTLSMDDIVIQSGPVGQSSAKEGVQSGTSQNFTQRSIVKSTRSEGGPSATATRQSNLINLSVERKRKRVSIELGAIGETVNCKALQHKSPGSSFQDRGSRQLELAKHRLAESEPASTKPAGTDESERLRTARRTLLPSVETDGMTVHLATLQLTPSSGETSPISPKHDSMSAGGLEAGDSTGLDLRLSSRVRILEVFCWPRDGQRGPYVVVMFERQLGLVAAAIGMVGAFLYFAYRWLL
jgi:hypothetical protein